MKEEIKSNDDLLQEFIGESDKRLIKIRKDLKKLQKQPDNKEIVHQILRGFHNLKSTAFSLQLPNIRRISHLTEDVLILIRDEIVNLDSRVISLLLESIDYLDEALINLYENGFEGRHSPVRLIIKLKEFIDPHIKPPAKE
jgi:two-component system, chemotaxis family, sensor kinase CheA